MATVSNQPIRSPRDGILAELNDKLNRRRGIFEQSSEVTITSPLSKHKPRPPLKNRSESLVDVQKYRVAPNDGITQSLSVGSVQSDHLVQVPNGHHSRSLPKSRAHTVLGPPPTVLGPPPTVLGPPPTRPPPTFKALRYTPDSKVSL